MLMKLNLLINRCRLTCVAVLAAFSVYSNAFTVDGLQYSQIAGKNEVILLKGTVPESGEVIIPSSVEYEDTEYTVTMLLGNAFKNCTTLKSVIIPETIYGYGDNVFYNCTSLTSVKLPDNCPEIPAGYFSGCTALTSIELPPNIKSIKSSAFLQCTSLEEINIPESVTVIGHAAFAFCSSLKQIHSSSVLTIEGYAFQTCTSLTNVDFPNVETIGQYTFAHCNELKTVTLGEKIKSIGDVAFRDCTNLELFTVLAVEPPTALENTFDTAHYSSVDLRVPAESIEKYRTAPVWENFFKDRNPLTAIEGVEAAEGAESEVVARYDLSGRPVADDYRGMTIVRRAYGSTAKEILR